MIELLTGLLLLALPSVDLLGLGECPDCRELPRGWTLRPVSGAAPPMFTIRRDGEGDALRVSGRDAAAWAYRELDRPLTDENGLLRWTWRALERPEGADLGDRQADDAPLRVYVVFGKPSLFGAARAIFYSWGNAEDEHLARAGFGSDRVGIVRVAGTAEADSRWRTESVRPFDDYRRFWGEDAPPIHIVGVMQDTDATGGAATAELAALLWQPAVRPAG